MTLEKSDRFYDELEDVLDFISIESPSSALKFYDDLIEKIEKIPLNPYLYRKRESFNSDSDRELIFKGYTIPIHIDENTNKIYVLGIFNQNLWE